MPYVIQQSSMTVDPDTPLHEDPRMTSVGSTKQANKQLSGLPAVCLSSWRCIWGGHHTPSSANPLSFKLGRQHCDDLVLWWIQCIYAARCSICFISLLWGVWSLFDWANSINTNSFKKLNKLIKIHSVLRTPVNLCRGINIKPLLTPQWPLWKDYRINKQEIFTFMNMRQSTVRSVCRSRMTNVFFFLCMNAVE